MPEQSLVDLLQTLVAIPSVNPDLTDDPSTGGEARMADYLGQFLAGRGFTVERHEVIKGRPNILARIGSSGARKKFMIEVHLDTQGVQGMTVPPFEGRIEDGRLYGRGACDMKGPMAAALFALQPDVLRALADGGVELIFVGAIGEERGNIGAEQLVAMGIGADEALVLEPTDLNIVHAHKGAFWFEVETQGVAAHGSNPDGGLSAVAGMMGVLEMIDARTKAARKIHQHTTLGVPTANIGIIRGGTSTNIVPDRCVIEVDRRTIPGETSAQILDDIKNGLDEIKKAGRISGWRVKEIKDGVPFETATDGSLIKRLRASCAEHAVTARVEGAAWYSDAGPFSRTCRQVAVFGPGSIAQAHTADEYIELASLQKGSDILKTFLKQLAAGS